MRTLVMTGGTRGLGLRTVEMVLSRPDWRVLIIGRNFVPSPEIERLNKDRVDFVHCDLSELAAVNAACDTVIAKVGPGGISALSLNAGLNSTIHAHASPDGYEIHFAVNHLAHVLIADRLAPYIEKDGRIVITSSVTHDPDAFCLIGIERPEWQDPYLFADPEKSQDYVKSGDLDRGEARYSVSKMCNIMQARTLAKERPEISAVSFNPSVVPGTEIVRHRDALQKFLWRHVAPVLAPIIPGMRHIDRSAGDLTWLLCDAYLKPASGSYFDGRRPVPGSKDSRDPDKIEQVMRVSRELIAKALAKPKAAVNA
jgi:NAD(P)-dependent dehydrogenase (short-subunit alcohol dehydrogenase family)